MAFDLNKLSRAAPLAYNRSLFAYVSSDSLSTIEAAGYFNAAAAKMSDGDLIIISGNEVSQTYTVTGNDGSTVVISSGLADGGVPVAAGGVILSRDERSAGYTLAAAQHNRPQHVTTASIAVTIPSAATLGTNFRTEIWNISGGIITLGSVTMQDREVALVAEVGGTVYVTKGLGVPQ